MSQRLALPDDVESRQRIISVEDHVVESPDVRTDRILANSQERASQVVRKKVRLERELDGVGSALNTALLGGWIKGDDGVWSDVWHYEDVVKPRPQVHAAANPAISRSTQLVCRAPSKALQRSRDGSRGRPR